MNKSKKTKTFFKLTNLEIEKNYSTAEFYLSSDEFVGAFACWSIKQASSDQYDAVLAAIKAYEQNLHDCVFSRTDLHKVVDGVIKMNYSFIKKLTSEDFFKTIPEILALNTTERGKDFVDLGALSRNVFFHILREEITQPL